MAAIMWDVMESGEIYDQIISIYVQLLRWHLDYWRLHEISITTTTVIYYGKSTYQLFDKEIIDLLAFKINNYFVLRNDTCSLGLQIWWRKQI